MSNFKKILGFIWASPVTFTGLIYVLLFTLFGWYKHIPTKGPALVWLVQTEKAPKWLMNRWSRWGGHAVGNVVVVKYDLESNNGKTTLTHELEHVYQCMVLGIFQPIFYGLIWLIIKVGCKECHPYFSHPFEIDARRAAGQLVDVEGAIKRAAATKRVKQ